MIKHVYMYDTMTYNGLFYLVNTCKIMWKQVLGVAGLGYGLC
jgi:hypothetical protein